MAVEMAEPETVAPASEASDTQIPDDDAPIQHPTLWYRDVATKGDDVQYLVQFYDVTDSDDTDKGQYRGFFMQPKPFAIQVSGKRSGKGSDDYVWEEGEPLFIVKTVVDGKPSPEKWSHGPIPDVATPNVKKDPAGFFPPQPEHLIRRAREKDGEAGEGEDIAKDPLLRLKDVVITDSYLAELYLCSPILVKYVRRFARNYPFYEQRGNRIIMDEPYEPMMHHYELIQALAGEPDEKHLLNVRNKSPPDAAYVAEVSRQFGILLEFLEPLYKAEYENLEQSLQQAESTLTTRYKFLWYIFKPGTHVYFEIEPLENVWAAGVIFNRVVDKRGLRLDIWMLSCDGIVIGRCKRTKRIINYSGERDLQELGVCPIQYLDASDGGKRRKEFIARGKQFVDILLSQNKEYQYDGVFIDPLKSGSDRYTSYTTEKQASRRHVQGRIIIDIGAAVLYAPDLVFDESDSFPTALFEVRNNGLNPKPKDPADEDDKAAGADSDGKGGKRGSSDSGSENGDNSDDEDEEEEKKLQYEEFSGIEMDANTKAKLTDEHYLFMYPITMAFLREKKVWGVIQTGAVSSIKRAPNPLKTVVIDQDDLQTIEALTSVNDGGSKMWGADFVEGKGRGQIVLLHGPPGVGKTYTVECIAEAFCRPLLSLTMSDIGTEDQQMETQLARWFALAEKWKAIMLVDEADIFLERRKNADLNRNSIVTVFLRKMEYFSGLLFLTTNRVGQIDDAFVSRVHVFIGYGRLDDHKRGILWDSFFDKLTRERKGEIKVMPGAKNYVKKSEDVRQCDWNGREVRNALQTAIALATFEKKKELAEIADRADGDAEIDKSDELVCVEEHHFKRVVGMSRRFQKYLEGVANADEKLRSRRLKDRNDYHDMTDDGLSDSAAGKSLSAAGMARLKARRNKADA